MNYQLGSAYTLMSEVIVKQVMDEALYGKEKPKKKSLIKTIFKKTSK
ncbi:hypothetical protein [Vibrio ziniensis]|uniref:Uncharacterized protein n=1 Tax=Vibrio ziniensis TaxID=2711221 RepID=A0A6G7CP62_9VIBR|nr:hypothetical protein [Vibrio ziniensis]QIH43836.1 hypothetical protein G5S32_17800 [Vibrio ziniensis]